MSASIGHGTTAGRPARNLTPSDIEHLGAAGGWQFFRYPKGPDGSEYVLANVTMASAEVAQPPRPGELRIAVPRVKMEYGTEHHYVAVTRADKVQTGSYAAAVERDAKTARQLGAKEVRPANPVWDHNHSNMTTDDLLASLARRPNHRVDVSLDDGGRMLVLPEGGHLTTADREVIASQSRLIVARLTHVRVACELYHAEAPAPDAVVMDWFGTAACADHMAGRLPYVAPTPGAEAPKRSALGRFTKSTSA